MQLGLTWPLQRLLSLRVPYGAPLSRGFCWDAHCITLHGRSSLLLVHCQSRYTCVRFDLTPGDWAWLPDLAAEELGAALPEAGLDRDAARAYLDRMGKIELTRTHGRREVALLNRAWEDVLGLDLLADLSAQRQPMLNRAVNEVPCRCAGENGLAPARVHLERYFETWLRGEGAGKG